MDFTAEEISALARGFASKSNWESKARSFATTQAVIPAKAGIQRLLEDKNQNLWIPDRSLRE
jgi:hypothetical protein